jgi:hypothetical protein
MKCEKVLSSMASGGAFARWQARRHAARCPQCAREHRLLVDLAGELASAPPPLTAAQRALWTAASTEAIASRPRRTWVYPVGLAAATVILGAIGLELWSLQLGGVADQPTVVQFVPEPSETSSAQPPEHARLVDEMLAKVDRLDHELAELRREAELLDVRKDADALWAQYAPRKQSAL